MRASSSSQSLGGFSCSFERFISIVIFHQPKIEFFFRGTIFFRARIFQQEHFFSFRFSCMSSRFFAGKLSPPNNVLGRVVHSIIYLIFRQKRWNSSIWPSSWRSSETIPSWNELVAVNAGKLKGWWRKMCILYYFTAMEFFFTTKVFTIWQYLFRK